MIIILSSLFILAAALKYENMRGIMSGGIQLSGFETYHQNFCQTFLKILLKQIEKRT